jgi:glycosyltransferase involved in cell wall biosynthesis
MKIAIYNVTTGHQLGGIETYCIEMGKALNGLGHEVTLIAGQCENPNDVSPLKLELFEFRDRSRFWNLGTRFKKLMERLSFARHTIKPVLKAGFDAIVIVKPYDFPFAWLLRKLGYKGQILFHTGGTDFFLTDRFFARAVDHFIACSEYTARQNGQRYSREFHVIHNGVDTALFKPAPKDAQWRDTLGIPIDARVIMTVGRIVGWKGLDTIVKAIADLPDVHYVYVGHGPHEEKLKELAESLSVSARVHAAGALPHQQIPAAMNQADIFAQPSVGEEAFGITVIEAMACGLPVLASAQGGMLEIITSGHDGMLLPPGDVDAWRSAVALLSENSEQRKQLSDDALTTVRDRFTWMAGANQINSLILNIEHASHR